MERSADVVIIGAGIIGLSIGYELLRREYGRVLIVEKEIMPGAGETSRATGGIRLQFSSELNIKLSLISLERLLSLQEERAWRINLKQNGYLFLASSDRQLEMLREGQVVQHKLGIPSQSLTPPEIERLLPQLNLDGILEGSFCPVEGYADPSGLLQGYLSRINKMGGKLYTETEATGIAVEGAQVKGVRTTKGNISTNKVVNAAGPYASLIARMVNLDLPVVPYKRHTVTLSPVSSIKDNIPLVVDMSTGWYMKKEPNGGILMGGTDRDNIPSWDLNPDQDSLNKMIEAAIIRVPCLEEAGVVNSYVGLRSMSPDDHAILDEAEEVEGFYCACGFSGHGFMHAPAIGKIMADLISKGETGLLDVSSFNLKRFSSDNQMREDYVF